MHKTEWIYGNNMAWYQWCVMLRDRRDVVTVLSWYPRGGGRGNSQQYDQYGGRGGRGNGGYVPRGGGRGNNQQYGQQEGYGGRGRGRGGDRGGRDGGAYRQNVDRDNYGSQWVGTAVDLKIMGE
ncbi:hypothetical protein Tco_1172163, partial [Tanacetum coccineum]